MEREHRLTFADGRTLALLEFGERGTRPVLYFHGYPGSRLEGRLTLEYVRRNHLWLLAPDRPGFGGSTFRPGRTIVAWAADVAEMARQLEFDRFDVIGVSGGAPYALACAARIPERVGNITLVAPLGPLQSGHVNGDMKRLNRLALMVAARWPSLARLAVLIAARWVRRYPERYLSMTIMDTCPADRQVLANARYRSLIVASTAEALRHGGRGAAWELTLLARPWDFSLEEVRLPVRIWQGTADNIVPATLTRRLSSALPNSECHLVPGEGHLSLIVRYLDAALTGTRYDYP